MQSEIYTVDQRLIIPIYSNGREFTGTIVLTPLDEWPTRYLISDQADGNNDDLWSYVSGEMSGRLISDDTCRRCFLILEPVSLALPASVRVDISIVEGARLPSNYNWLLIGGIAIVIAVIYVLIKYLNNR